MKRLSHLLHAWLLLCVACPALAAAPDSVQASYDVYRDGMKVGEIKETYKRDNGRYTLSSTTTPTGLLAVLKPDRIFIESTGLLSRTGLQPEHFTHRREHNETKDSRADFDWPGSHLTLTQQAQHTVLDLPEGTQDRLSAMYQFMFLPLQNAAMIEFTMTNGSKLDHYRYAVSPGPKLKTPAGEFRTLYLDNQAKPGENRTEIWLAVQHHNLPCKMVITDADGEQLTQVLNKLVVTP